MLQLSPSMDRLFLQAQQQAIHILPGQTWIPPLPLLVRYRYFFSLCASLCVSGICSYVSLSNYMLQLPHATFSTPQRCHRRSSQAAFYSLPFSIINTMNM